MDLGLVVTITGLIVAGLASVLGIWMERDRSRRATLAVFLSMLIMAAVCVEIGRAVVEEIRDDQLQDDMARVLERLEELAESGENEALAQFVSAEVATQARSNPKVVKKMTKSKNSTGSVGFKNKGKSDSKSSKSAPGSSGPGKGGGKSSGSPSSKGGGKSSGSPSSKGGGKSSGSPSSKGGGKSGGGSSTKSGGKSGGKSR